MACMLAVVKNIKTDSRNLRGRAEETLKRGQKLFGCSGKQEAGLITST